MKMREKTKLKTIEEIPLEELESQLRDKGQFVIDCSRMQQIIHIISYVENVSYNMTYYVIYDMQHIICKI